MAIQKTHRNETAPCRRANTETDNQMVDLNPEPLLWGISANHHCAALIEKIILWH